MATAFSRAVTLTEDGKGTIEEGEIVENDFESPLFAGCVTDALTRAEFPAPTDEEGRVTVSYPFQLSPE